MSFSAPDVEDDPSDDPDFNPYVLDDSDDEADLQDNDKVSSDRLYVVVCPGSRGQC